MEFDYIFDELEIYSNPFALCQLRGRCDLGLKQQAGVMLHFILAGQGEIVIHNKKSVKVGPGMLALVPSHHSHVLRSTNGAVNTLPQCQPVDIDLLNLVKHGEDTATGGLLAICSHIDIGFRGTRGVINLLRAPMIKTAGAGTLLGSSIDQMLAELSHPKLGSRAVIRTIILQCVIDLLREKLIANDPGLRWMTVLKDERIWSALQVMLEEPSGKHTVESLAERAGMSRSTFAQRFAQAYGNGPMNLLRDLRMNHAALLLEQSQNTIDRIAQMSGFASRSSFSHAFKLSTGSSPANFRRHARQ